MWPIILMFLEARSIPHLCDIQATRGLFAQGDSQIIEVRQIHNEIKVRIDNPFNEMMNWVELSRFNVKHKFI